MADLNGFVFSDEFEKAIQAAIPDNEKIIKVYRAFEGDMRIITENEKQEQNRYSIQGFKENILSCQQM